MHSPYVTTLQQTYFSEEQKAQARENLGLAAVAASGDYADLSNKPTITQPVNADWNSNSGLSQILNKPNLAVVATSGNYSDLNNRPTIPAAQVNSDWNSSSGVSQILNKPNLATVATSGSYADLSNKPSIPTVNDGNLKFALGSATATKVFSANQSVDSTITVPERTYTVSGSTTTYGPGLPTLEDMQAIYTQPDWNATSGVAAILNKPTIPTVNDGTLTITQGSTTLGTFTANQSSNSTIAIPAPPHVPVQYYDFANFLSFPITSNTSYSTYLYVYPANLDKTKDYIVTFSVNISQPSGETWSLGNADIPYHFNVDTTGSFSVADTTSVMTNLGGRSLYASSLSFTVKIPNTYMSGENLNFLLYLPPNTLTTSNTVELSYKVYYQEYIA